MVEPGEEDGLPAGIRNSGHTNVVIRNGTVRGFGYGVLLTSGTTHNIVEDMTLDASILAGIELNDADDGRNGNLIRDNTITSSGEGAINLFNDAENSVIVDNGLDGNAGVAFHLLRGARHRIEDNDVTGVPIDPLLDSDGGALLEGSTRQRDRRQLVLRQRRRGHRDHRTARTATASRTTRSCATATPASAIQDSDRNRVIGNIAHQASDGGVVVSNGHDTVVRGNDVRFNPSGVDASNANRLLIEDNDASDTLQAGIAVGNGVGVRILDNVANRTGGSGISIEGGAFDAAGAADRRRRDRGQHRQRERRERHRGRRRRPHDPRQRGAQQRRLRHRRGRAAGRRRDQRRRWRQPGDRQRPARAVRGRRLRHERLRRRSEPDTTRP